MKIELPILPVKDVMINQPFGVNWIRPGFYKLLGIPSDKHNGIDWNTEIGCPVVSMHDGVCVWADLDGQGGLVVKIISTNVGEGFYTAYLHLSRALVKYGDYVKAGQLIALAGNTGNSTGPHLHTHTKETFDGATINKENGFLGCIDQSKLFTDKDWDKSNAFKRYGRLRNWQTYIKFEVPVMITLRKYLKRNPTAEEINAAVYGGWDRETIKDPAMAYNWKYLTKNNFQNGKKPFC